MGEDRVGKHRLERKGLNSRWGVKWGEEKEKNQEEVACGNLRREVKLR